MFKVVLTLGGLTMYLVIGSLGETISIQELTSQEHQVYYLKNQKTCIIIISSTVYFVNPLTYLPDCHLGCRVYSSEDQIRIQHQST